MEFVNTFTVPVDLDTVFATMSDLGRVAPCLPGATLEAVEGPIHRGRIRVKVGPISVEYRGTAEVVESDPDNHRIVIQASGTENRGGGSASAMIMATGTAVPRGTEVAVTTQLSVTGKPAQVGRGVMAEVGSRVIDTFATRLSEMLSEATAAVRQSGGTPRRSTSQEPDVLQLANIAMVPLGKRVAVLVVVLVGVWIWVRSRTTS